jgi:threonine dehydrogenase-like Zn-dependent dehydrogenase
MGIVEGGNMALLGATGPMGLGAIDYAVHGPRKPKFLVATGRDNEKIKRTSQIVTVTEAEKIGIKLKYVNTRNIKNVEKYLIDLTDGRGHDDVFVFASDKALVNQADKILARDGCLNFFAGPADPEFSVEINFYNVHYNSTHVVGTSGGNTEDMIEAIELMRKGLINPTAMITHIGGLNSVVKTTLNLPKIPGGKKLIYTNIELELTAIEDFKEKGKEDPLFAELAKIVEKNNGLWCLEAEKYLLENAKPI